MDQHQLAADELAAQGAQAAAVLGGDAVRLVLPEGELTPEDAVFRHGTPWRWGCELSPDWQQEFTRRALDQFGHPLTLHYDRDEAVPGARIALSRDGKNLWCSPVVPDDMVLAFGNHDAVWEVAAKDFARSFPERAARNG